jgi:hypothetical protein
MNQQRAFEITMKVIFPVDNVVNWLLAAALVLAPITFEQFITRVPLLPAIVYRIIGAGFVVFALWQDWILMRKRRALMDMWVAGVLAILPAIALTVALIAFEQFLHPGALTGLWVGNVYMIVLGVWYLTIPSLTNEVRNIVVR